MAASGKNTNILRGCLSLYMIECVQFFIMNKKKGKIDNKKASKNVKGEKLRTEYKKAAAIFKHQCNDSELYKVMKTHFRLSHSSSVTISDSR